MDLTNMLLNDNNFEEAGPANTSTTNLANPAAGGSTAPNTSAEGTSTQSDLNANGRRPRSSSDADAEETARQERRIFMGSMMDEYNIHGPARERGMRFADLDFSHQLMAVYTINLSQLSQTNNRAAIDFLNGTVYETHVINHIKVALLLPWLKDYVTIWTEALLDDMQRSPQAWRIPPEVMQQADQWACFASEFKIKTTQLRSQNKTTLYRLRAQNVDINKIIRAVMPRGMAIAECHRARLAWIMLASVEFDELVEQREISRTKFWEWIGSQVVALKKKIHDDPRYTTDQERRSVISRVFTRALARHRELFPPIAPVEPPQARPAWQETLEEALSMGASI